jgi:hypothetical protein
MFLCFLFFTLKPISNDLQPMPLNTGADLLFTYKTGVYQLLFY